MPLQKAGYRVDHVVLKQHTMKVAPCGCESRLDGSGRGQRAATLGWPTGSARLLAMTPEEVATRRAAALQRALEWAHVVQNQVVRLHSAEQAAYAASEARRSRSGYAHADSKPFFDLRAETYFLTVTARQLLRALDIYGDKKKVPAPLSKPQAITDLRNALEHWDGDEDKLARHTEGASTDYQWGAGGTIIAGFLSIDELADWAAAVERYLLRVSNQR
jgi:hypothetical protein